MKDQKYLKKKFSQIIEEIFEDFPGSEIIFAAEKEKKDFYQFLLANALLQIKEVNITLANIFEDKIFPLMFEVDGLRRKILRVNRKNLRLRNRIKSLEEEIERLKKTKE